MNNGSGNPAEYDWANEMDIDVLLDLSFHEAAGNENTVEAVAMLRQAYDLALSNQDPMAPKDSRHISTICYDVGVFVSPEPYRWCAVKPS